MRIGLNARFMVDPSRRGFNRYTYSLAKALSRIDGVELWLISEAPIHKDFLGDLTAHVIAEGAFKPVWWEQVVLPRIIKKLNLDVFHAPASVGLPLRKVCPYVLTIHDVIGKAAADIVGQRDSLKARVQNRVLQMVSLHAASRLITVSEHSKRDICRYLGVAADRVEVIYEAADEQFRVIQDRAIIAAALRRHHIEPPYILYVGGFDRRKNIDALIRAFARSKARSEATLALVGAKSGEHVQLSATIREVALETRVRFAGYVPDDDLALLYNGASVFVYPSLYEGFGLPPIEALACGVPVLASNRTSLPEVLNGAATLFDPTQIAGIAAAIDQAFGDRDLASRSRLDGPKVAARFSWQKTAKRTLEVYRSALGTSSVS